MSWLPNWKDEKSYPLENASPSRWAWEFLRRNSDYQKDWNEQIAPYYNFETLSFDDEAARKASGTRIQDLPFGLLAPQLRFVCEKYKIEGIPPHPSHNNPQDFGFSGHRVKYDRRPTHYPEIVNYSSPWSISSTEIAIWYDLSLPLEGQIERAEQLLKQKRQEMVEADKVSNQTYRLRSKQYSLYKLYIRLLDAKTVNSEDATIASILLPHLSDTYEDNYRASGRIKDSLAAAIKLRDYDYRFLVVSQELAEPLTSSIRSA